MDSEVFYTTGQAAKACQLSPSTIRRLFDDGYLDGKRDFGTFTRFISLASLINLMRLRGIPTITLNGDPHARAVLLRGEVRRLQNMIVLGKSQDPIILCDGPVDVVMKLVEMDFSNHKLGLPVVLRMAADIIAEQVELEQQGVKCPLALS